MLNLNGVPASRNSNSRMFHIHGIGVKDFPFDRGTCSALPPGSDRVYLVTHERKHTHGAVIVAAQLFV